MTDPQYGNPGRLYYGDCLTVMSEWPTACVDLIYLDPPFNSNRSYNAIYKDETGRPLPDQIEAFCDMWELDAERERAIRTMPVLMRNNGVEDSTAELWRLWMQALRGTQPQLLAYLSYMAERMLVMKRILKPTEASISTATRRLPTTSRRSWTPYLATTTS